MKSMLIQDPLVPHLVEALNYSVENMAEYIVDLTTKEFDTAQEYADDLLGAICKIHDTAQEYADDLLGAICKVHAGKAALEALGSPRVDIASPSLYDYMKFCREAYVWFCGQSNVEPDLDLTEFLVNCGSNYVSEIDGDAWKDGTVTHDAVTDMLNNTASRVTA